MRACDAFDDILGAEPPVDVIDMMGATLRVLGGRRLRPLPQRLESTDVDSTEWSFTPVTKQVVGADTHVAKGAYPLFDFLRVRFLSAIGRPKLVRVDTEKSYQEFRAVRRKPHLDDVDARLAQLEHAFVQHLDDEEMMYEAAQPPFDQEYEHQMIGVVVDAVRGGRRVPLGLPPAARGNIEGWLDGDEVLVSARAPVGIVTTGTPIYHEFETVVGCAESAGCTGVDALVIGAQLAPSTAGRSLLLDLALVVPELVGVDLPFVVTATPHADAGMAAAIALLQRAQNGDRTSIREAVSLANNEGADLIEEAGRRLAYAQEQKARS